MARSRRVRRLIVSVALAVLMLLPLLPSAANAFVPPATGRWVEQTLGVRPAARFGAIMGFHEGAKAAAMFGGCGATTRALVEVSHYEPRVHAHNQYLEWCTAPHADTWIWGGSGWSQAGTGPEARFAGTMAYDYSAGALVLFGGITATLTATANATPPAGSVSCTHAITQLKVLQGDHAGKYLNFYCFGDTWYLKKFGTSWQWSAQSPATSPPARFDPFGATDRTGDAVIGQGCSSLGTMRFRDPDTDPNAYYFDCFHRAEPDGSDTTGYRRDAWVWNHQATTWQRRAADAAADADCRAQNVKVPVCRRGTGAAYNAVTEAVFIFGGFFLENFGGTSFAYNQQTLAPDHAWQWRDAWLFTCRTEDWTAPPPDDPDRPPTSCTGDPSPTTTPGRRAFAGVTSVWWEGGFKPFVFAGLGATTTSTMVENKNDLWMWQSEPVPVHFGVQKGTWVRICGDATCATRPSARQSPAVAYSPGTAGHLLAFGGRAADGTILGDTWTFGAPSPLSVTPCTSCLAS